MAKKAKDNNGAPAQKIIGLDGAGDGAAAGQQADPSMHVLAQYVKDLSFENPNAPSSLMMSEQPEINVQVNVNGRKQDGEDDVFEVVLETDITAKLKDVTVFAVELVYGGMFQIQNMPEDMLQPVVMIECPRILFPFARQVLADAIRDGGFPPLMLDPIDFAALYRHRMEQVQAEKAETGGLDA